MNLLASFVSTLIVGIAHLVTAVRGNWKGTAPSSQQRVYYANHASHGDFVLIWTVLPPHIRRQTRPVAGADYWLKTRLKTFIGREVFNAVLIDRNPENRDSDPVSLMADALDDGDSLILFPEGTRNTTKEILLPFKSGLYHLASKRPDIELVPAWIDNLNRVMPKGALVPIPIACSVTFGEPIQLNANETKETFLSRAERALLMAGGEYNEQ